MILAVIQRQSDAAPVFIFWCFLQLTFNLINGVSDTFEQSDQTIRKKIAKFFKE
jgi:hypothetical protein